MSRINNPIVCANCNRLHTIIDEQKSKLQLLETRLKDLIKAYKLVCKERDHMQKSSSSSSLLMTSISDNVQFDQRQQQKRIAELEQNVCELSKICGDLENEHKSDQLIIQNLQHKYQTLQDELNENSSKLEILNHSETKSIELCEKFIQTDDEIIVEKNDVSTQTDNKLFEKHNDDQKSINENETAIITPYMHVNETKTIESESTTDVDDSVSINSDLNHELMKQQQHQLNQSTSNISLFHLNELARKELELADYRLRIREYECTIRELQWNYSNDRYKYQSRIADLEKLNKNIMINNENAHHKNDNNNHRLKNNINIAYIKNVLNKMMQTVDKQQQKLMMDALITALDSM